jgi:hypothetical protein
MKKVMIQRGILNNLKPLIVQYNETTTPKIKQDVAVLFLSLINELESHYRIDESEEDRYTPLCSQTLKQFHASYNKYFNFFVNNDILIKKNYSTDMRKSNSYKISETYSNDELIPYEIKYNKLKEKFDEKGLNKSQLEKLEDCKRKRPHLMEIFSDDLTIDVASACEEIIHLNRTAPRKYNNAMVLINEFENKVWKATINPYNSDYRLHTNLTRSPKVLRKHILINNENIIGFDVKTSQPYFFCVILKAILNQDITLLKKIGATKILNGNTVEQLFNLGIDRKEITEFVLTVINHEIDFYEGFAAKLEIKIDEEGRPYRMISNFKKSSNSRSKQQEAKSKKTYESIRGLAKEVVMEIFYSSPMSKVQEAVLFRKTYPSIHMIINCLHNNSVKFHQLLTTIEAYVLLDVVAKQIKDRYPHLPLGSIHDCLVTTSNHERILGKEMKVLLEAATTLKVKIELEQWGNTIN